MAPHGVQARAGEVAGGMGSPSGAADALDLHCISLSRGFDRTTDRWGAQKGGARGPWPGPPRARGHCHLWVGWVGGDTQGPTWRVGNPVFLSSYATIEVTHLLWISGRGANRLTLGLPPVGRGGGTR